MSTNNMKEENSITTELSAKYLDFQDIFSKAKANKLPKYNEHDMPIDFKDKKISLISLIYDMFRLKLQAMHEYINKMLAKSFIISFKLFIKASIIFIKKKNCELYFCIDYCGINTIIKKNKHSILLMRNLLNTLNKA